MAQFENQQRTVANLTRPVTELDSDISGGDGKETSMAFSLEFERCLIELADEVYGLSKPKEIAQKVLSKACEFYDADWCGIFDADMMLKLWMPFWWYNRTTGGMTKTKTDMDQYGISGELPRWRNAIQQNTPIIILNVHYVDSFGFTEVPEFLQTQILQNVITMASDKITVNQHIGTWYPIDMQEIDGRTYFLLEHETYGSDVAGVIVDEKGVLYAQEIFDGFTPEVIVQIQLAAAPVEVMPDPSVSVDDMVAYGYSYMGMVPLKADAAEGLCKEGNMLLYALHPDGTESVIGNEKQFHRHKQNGGLFAVDKQDWMKYLENGEYLRTAEMSTEQNFNMIDGRRNNMEQPKKVNKAKEKESLLGRLKEKQELLLVSRKKDAQEKSNERDIT